MCIRDRGISSYFKTFKSLIIIRVFFTAIGVMCSVRDLLSSVLMEAYPYKSVRMLSVCLFLLNWSVRRYPRSHIEYTKNQYFLSLFQCFFLHGCRHSIWLESTNSSDHDVIRMWDQFIHGIYWWKNKPHKGFNVRDLYNCTLYIVRL